MSLDLWRARLSEGWCPRPEHGRRLYTGGESGSWCVDCHCGWFLRDGVIRATSYQEFRHSWDATLTEDNVVTVLSGIDMWREMAEGLSRPSFATARLSRMTGAWIA